MRSSRHRLSLDKGSAAPPWCWWGIALLVLALRCGGAESSWQVSSKASVLVCGGSMMNGDRFTDSVIDAMRQHYAGCRLVALVLHASHPDDRDRMEVRLRKAFEHLGVAAAESLHRYDPTGARALLEKADAFFIGGGETFVLLGELVQTGQLELIRNRVLVGVPYGGASAGANVAGLIIGTTNDFPVADVPSRAALGLLPVTINPHHPTPEQKSDYDARAGKIRTYLRFNPGERVLGLGNASILRLHGGKAEMVAGHGWLYDARGMRSLELKQPLPELSEQSSAGR